MYRASCTVYYPDQQMHNIYIYIYIYIHTHTHKHTHILTIFYISQVLLHASIHLHHLQTVLSFCSAKVTKIITVSNPIKSIPINQPTRCNYLSSLLLDVSGHAVAQLVEALHYKPEGCGFDSRWCHWIFSLI